MVLKYKNIMGKFFMIKVDATVKRETKYIAFFCTILSVLMQAVFVLLKRWDYTVILGNLLSLAAAVLNFLIMGITVQKSLELDSADAKKLIKSSQGLRSVAHFAVLAAGVIAPIFNTVAVIIPVFFPRIAVALRPLIKDKQKGSDR